MKHGESLIASSTETLLKNQGQLASADVRRDTRRLDERLPQSRGTGYAQAEAGSRLAVGDTTIARDAAFAMLGAVAEKSTPWPHDPPHCAGAWEGSLDLRLQQPAPWRT
jgi:hypothetical protein